MSRNGLTPTKAPPRVEPSDDYVVLDGDSEYRPHQGETVTFRPRIRIEDMIGLLKALSFGTTSDDGRDMRETIDESFAGLAAVILAWTWTDDDGEAYPSPPSVADLRQLSPDEIIYLIRGAQRTRTPVEAKNG